MTIPLDISGLGILIYSPWAVRHIRKGEDYLEHHYRDPGQVLKHVLEGSLVGFATGSPGSFVLEVRSGIPEEAELQKAEFKLRLAVRVEDGTICFRDLYDLIRWQSECPAAQTLKIPDGLYQITVHGDRPASGTLGDHQTIWIHLSPLDRMPALKYAGVPTLA